MKFVAKRINRRKNIRLAERRNHWRRRWWLRLKGLLHG